MVRRLKYLRPATPMEACAMKAKHGKMARFWAGGTDLLLQWREGMVDLEYCIDLSFLSALDYIKHSGDHICIGALTKIASIEESNVVKNLLPALSQAASQMATPQIRNIATMGGNLCNASPSADLAMPLLAFGGEARLLSVSGGRCIALEDFFLGVNETALKENELLAEIKVPISPLHIAATFLKFGRTAVDIALVNTSVSIALDNKGTCSEAGIVLGAVAPVPMRAKGAERLLIGASIAQLNKDYVEEVSIKAASETKPITDWRASAEFRQEISKILVSRAMEDVVQKLGGRAA
jgi:CO/xanthine dehydrogenase FAD-binding subunit